MPVFWGMLIFCAVSALLGHTTFTKYSQQEELIGTKTYYRKIVWLILLSWSVMIFFAAMRSVVSDTWAYAYVYQGIPTDISKFSEFTSMQTKDKLFWAASMIFKCFVSDSYHTWFFVITLICCLLLASTIAKMSPSPLFSAFLFLITCYFTWLFNGMRQFLAACILFYAYRYIVQGNAKKYVLLCCVAATMHVTALIGIPIYFIVRGKPFNKRVIVSVLLAGVVIISLDRLLPIASSFFADSAYDGVIQQFQEDDGVNIVRILISAVPSVLYFVFGGNNVECDQVGTVFLNISVFAIIFNLVGRFTSGVYIGRMTIYFDLANLVVYPWLFANRIRGENKKVFLFLLFLFYFIFFYYQMVITWDGFGYVSDVLNINLR